MIHAPPLAGRRWPPVKSWSPWELFLEGCRTEHLPAHLVRQGQRRQLEELVRHAKAFVPYYQEALAHIDPEDFERSELPILSRATLQSRKDDFVPRRLPSGMTLSGGAHTSGTTGEPVYVNYTNAQHAWYSAHLLRCLQLANFRQDQKLAAIRHIGIADDVPAEVANEIRDEYLKGQELPRWDPGLVGLIETGPGFGMSIEQDPRTQYQWLKRIEPRYLLSHPSNLVYLAGLCGKHGAISSLESVLTMGESLSEEARDEIERVMHVDVFDVYSCREVGYVASSCTCGFYHVYDDNVIVELLDDDDQPCAPGETGRVVLTGLHTFATPLIRYDIGDRARSVAKGADATCWRVQGLSSLLSIEGRKLPLLLLPGEVRKDPMSLVAAVRQAGDGTVSQFSIEQEASDQVVISAALSGPFESDSQRFIVAVTQAVWEFFGSTDVQVKTNLTPRLPLGATGKAPPVVSCRV